MAGHAMKPMLQHESGIHPWRPLQLMEEDAYGWKGDSPEQLAAQQEGELVHYCLRCRGKTSMVDTEQEIMKNGQPMIRGRCASCGAKMSKMMPMEKK